MKTSRNNNGGNKRIFTRFMQEKLAVTFLVTMLALFGLVVVLYQMIEQQEKRIINQVNAIIETAVVPKIQLIAEQHSEIIEKLSVSKEVDSLKGRVSTLEGTVKTHTAQITELKKAQ